MTAERSRREVLRRTLESDNDPLAERCQRRLNPLGPRCVLWVKHPADNGFAYAKPSRQFRVSHSARAHGQVKGQLRRQVEGNADRILATLQFGRGGNSVASDHPSGNGFGQAVCGPHERVFKIVSPGQRFGQIPEPA